MITDYNIFLHYIFSALDVYTWYVSLDHTNGAHFHRPGAGSPYDGGGSSGEDIACGGSLVFPCSSLEDVMKRAKPNDVILVDGAPTTKDSGVIYELCDSNSMVISTLHNIKSLTLIGYNGFPKIGCSLSKIKSDTPESEVNIIDNIIPAAEKDRTNIERVMNLANRSLVNNNTYDVEYTTVLELSDNITTYRTTDTPDTVGNQPCELTFKNIEIKNGFVSFRNCTVVMINTIFDNASFIALDPCSFLYVNLHNVTVDGHVECSPNGICVNTFLSNITCADVNLTVEDSQFHQTTLIVEGHWRTRVKVIGSLFSNKAKKLRFLGGLHLTFSALNADIQLKNSIFEKQVHPNRVQSVINLYEAAIWLKASMVSPNNGTTTANATVQNCTFLDNERGITIVGPFQKLQIANSRFERNVAMHAGAAILILINKDTKAIIYDVTFIGNVAGKFRNDYPVYEDESSFRVVGSEVHLNTSCCKGVIDFVGKGGAVRIQRGETIIRQCTFINNTARLLGGSVFVDIDGEVFILDTNFENTPSHDHALQGDIVYSDGKLTIQEVEFMVRTAVNGLSIFRHSGDHWTLDITNVWIQCPIEYDLRTTNSSAYGVSPQGLRRSYKLDQLSYFCESCPRNKYSLDHGYLNYTMIFNAFAYFTLLINGSEPKPQYTGNYIHHKIQCEDCPYGGHCVQGITSVANFWGYEYDNAVKFQHCPKGYCCSTTECPTINSCSPRRRGTLCGRCMEGYSEALFSSNCIPNEQCGELWIYPFSTGIGLIYAIFLLFQADLQIFLFSKPLGFKKVISKFHRKAQPKLTYMNGLVNNDGNQDGTDVKFIPNGGDIFKANGSNNHQQQKGSDEIEDTKQSKKDNKGFGSGFLVIMFYYFQDALLLNVKTVYVSAESKGQQLMKSILSGIFKFQLDLFELLEEVCVAPNMTVVPKQLAKTLIVPYVLGLFVLMYICYSFFSMLRGSGSSSSMTNITSRQSGSSSSHNHSDIDNSTVLQSNRKSFKTRLASGFILALLFMFQKLGTTTFILLNCVPVKDKMVLFIDGTITCYETWQYAVMAYTTICVTPFFLVLLVGPTLLRQGKISLLHFFIASLCPLPFLFIWTVRFIYRLIRGKTTGSGGSSSNRPVGHSHPRLPDSVRAVLQILQGPFKENACGLCWSGVLIGRRLVLILLFTFVTDTLIRLLCMLLACFVILLHHVHVKPYKDNRGNLAGTVSASALVVAGSINLVRAGFEAAEYTPAGPNAYLMKVFDHIENVLLLWGPLCIMSCLVLMFIFRVVTLIVNSLCGQGRNNAAASSSSIQPPAALNTQLEENSHHS